MRLIIVLILLLITASANYALSRPEVPVQRRPLSEFPKTIGDWTLVREHEIDDGSMAVLQVDDYIMRTYRNTKGETIGLYIGYFMNQREGKQVHSPRQCLPGAGWNVVQAKEVQLPVGKHKGSRGTANMFVMGKGSEREIYLWWYQGRGRVYANEYVNKLYLILDSITKSRTDGALVRINMAKRADLEKAVATQMAFASLFSSALSQYVPD